MMGKRFFESQLPELTKAINRLADAVEKSNELAAHSNREEVIASAEKSDGCE